MDLMRAFTEHPASVGETYSEHMGRAAGFGFRMIGAGVACLVHALLPFLFARTGSSAIAELNDRMVVNRHRGTRSPIATTRLPL
ncbi:MAG TPA: DUF6356 family protein [Steroidobacteraceae bacterium]|nr:DUF6356 family protein [Steroidobacteraceae bacterium]